jgi:hypothetical protein
MKKKLKRDFKSKTPNHLRVIRVLESTWSISDNDKLFVTFEVENKQKPIFKLSNKFMYEGDEYWVVRLAENWRLSKRLVKNRKPITSKLKYIFQTKQEALEFVLEEAKERFKGCRKVLFKDKEEYEINIESIKIDYWNEPKYKGNVVHVNTLKGYGVIGLNLWRSDKGWIAEPIKEPSLMLGDEVVEIEKKTVYEDITIRHGVTADWAIVKTYVKCKGESVTKEEWIKFYHSLKESWEWVKEATLQLGNYEVWD